MTQVLFKDLARATGRAFDNILDFFSSEPMIGWMKRLNLKELGNLSMMIKRMRIAKSRLRFEEQEYPISDGANNLKRALDNVQRDRKINIYIKLNIQV